MSFYSNYKIEKLYLLYFWKIFSYFIEMWKIFSKRDDEDGNAITELVHSIFIRIHKTSNL